MTGTGDGIVIQPGTQALPSAAPDPSAGTRRVGAETVLWRGRELLLRPIEPADDERHGAFFAGLAPEDLRMRFFGNRRDVSPAEIDRQVHPDESVEVAFVVLAQRAGAPPEEWAAAQAVAGADNVEAEFGIAVRSDLKGRGLGRILLAKLIDSVKGRGTRRISCEVLHENLPMRALAARLGFRIEKRSPEQGSLRYVLDLQAAA